MSKLKAYAQTSVSLFKTQDDLERLLSKHSITVSRWMHFAETEQQPGMVRFEFEWQRPNARVLAFRIEVSYQYVRGPKGGQQGTAREQAGRALFWHVKNLLDAVDFGIVDLEQAFLPYLLAASGQTLYDQIAPQIDSLPDGKNLLGLPPGDGKTPEGKA